MRYRKIPPIIEAIQFDGSWGKVWNFTGKEKTETGLNFNGSSLYLKTPEGKMHVSIGDYIVKGVNGEFCPCKPDIFERIYEAVV